MLLAGKVEETPKKCKNILKVIRSLPKDQWWAGVGNNPTHRTLSIKGLTVLLNSWGIFQTGTSTDDVDEERPHPLL